MDRYLLRAEAINIYGGVLDTDQLSVVRGSGLLLREAIRQIAKPDDATLKAKIGTVQSWKPISQGASIGLFRFESPTPDHASAVRQAVIDFLNNHAQFRLFTFVVAVTPWPESESFSIASERLLTDIRCQQQRQPSLAFDPAVDQYEDKPACAWNRMRPANPANEVERDPETVVLSESVYQRYLYGRSAKKADETSTPLARFYQEETSDADAEVKRLLDTVKFAHDFHQIAHAPDLGTLSDKLAVFYADGNRFSRIVRELADETELHGFDQDLRDKRKKLLTGLLRWADATPGMRRGKRGLRFEVLLWGGDEIMVVVPAWCGAALLAQFFALTAGWQPKIPETHRASLQHDNKPALTADGYMTHAAGLVFCHTKTPIARIRALANELADRAKDALGASVANVYEVAALESIDYPAEALDDYYRHRFGATASNAWKPRRAVSSEALGELRKKLAELPRRQVYDLAHCLAAGNGDAIGKRKARMKKLLGAQADPIAAALHAALGPHPAGGQVMSGAVGFDSLDNWVWLHLRELWDYLAVDLALDTSDDHAAPRHTDAEVAA